MVFCFGNPSELIHTIKDWQKEKKEKKVFSVVSSVVLMSLSWCVFSV
jgi:hypothetical protein